MDLEIEVELGYIRLSHHTPYLVPGPGPIRYSYTNSGQNPGTPWTRCVYGLDWPGARPGLALFRPGLGLKSGSTNKWASLGLIGRKPKAGAALARIYFTLS